MHRPRSARLIGSLAVVGLVLGACNDEPTTPSSGLQPVTAMASSGVTAAAGTPHSSVDSEFVALSKSIPGFGGLYYDAVGTPTVHLVDQAQQALARATLASTVRALNGRANQIRFQHGDFDFAQLNAWRKQLPPVLAIKGVVFTDVDEAANRVHVGVEDASVATRVREQIAALNIPAAAVVISEAKPFHFQSTLSSGMRPTAGGIKIGVPYTSDPQGAGFFCTLGFNAYRHNDTYMGLVTNSHCTKTQGGVEYSNYYQPDYSSNANLIGVEIVDPTYYTGGACPSGRRCRYSDAAFATYYNATGTMGQIARTTVRGSLSGSTTIDPAKPRFTMVSDNPYPYAGETLDKVGITTGWTSGVVTSSCVDINVGASDVTLWCQDIVAAGSDHGDSGSPVFYYLGDTPLGPNAISLVGILWGGNGAGTFAMSELASVESELLLDRVR